MSTARILDTITEWPQDPIFAEGWHLKFPQDKPCPYKNCYRGFGGVWQVKMFIGGEQRVVGESFNALRAVRFADMALLHFAKYRVRRNRPVIDSDLNFSLLTAKRDTAEVPAATAMLKAWEDSLLKSGLIAAKAETKLIDARTAQQVRRDVRLHFRQYRIDCARAAELVGFYPEAKVSVEMVADLLAQLETLNESIDAALVRDSATTPATP